MLLNAIRNRERQSRFPFTCKHNQNTKIMSEPACRKENQALTNSKLVAMKFGKRHSDAIRAIEDVFPKLSENEQKRNFALSEEDADSRRKRKMVSERTGKTACRRKQKLGEPNRRRLAQSDFCNGCNRIQTFLPCSRTCQDHPPKKEWRQGRTGCSKRLRKRGYLGTKGECHNQPMQRRAEAGMFEIKKRTIAKPNGDLITASTPLVTGKGQAHLANKFLKEYVSK